MRRFSAKCDVSCQLCVVSCYETGVRRQRTDVRKQTTDNRSQMTECIEFGNGDIEYPATIRSTRLTQKNNQLLSP
jgi:hypothetical protein